MVTPSSACRLLTVTLQEEIARSMYLDPETELSSLALVSALQVWMTCGNLNMELASVDTATSSCVNDVLSQDYGMLHIIHRCLHVQV